MNKIKFKMNVTNPITFSSKKLESGNLQVKFFIEGNTKSQYGYLLINGNCSDEEIMEEIKKRLTLMEHSKMDLQRFSFKQNWKDDHHFYLYSA